MPTLFDVSGFRTFCAFRTFRCVSFFSSAFRLFAFSAAFALFGWRLRVGRANLRAGLLFQECSGKRLTRPGEAKRLSSGKGKNRRWRASGWARGTSESAVKRVLRSPAYHQAAFTLLVKGRNGRMAMARTKKASEIHVSTKPTPVARSLPCPGNLLYAAALCYYLYIMSLG